MLKFKLDNLEGIPEPLAALYAPNEEDKKYYLQVEGVVAREKLEEFRTNNIELSNRVRDFDAKFKDVDPVKYKTLVDLEASGAFKGMSKEEQERIIGERVGGMKTEYETQINELKTKKDTLESQLNVLLIDNVVLDAAAKAGASGSAVTDILLRSKSTFKLVDGKPIPHDEQGRVLYSNDGTTPMSVPGWVASLKKTASHLFPQSQGGGANGGRAGDRGNYQNANLQPNQKISAGLSDRQTSNN